MKKEYFYVVFFTTGLKNGMMHVSTDKKVKTYKHVESLQGMLNSEMDRRNEKATITNFKYLGKGRVK